MVEAVETIDGWYSLHDLRKIDWVLWKNTSQETRDKAIQEFHSLYDEWNQVEAKEKGSQVMYQVIGQDADLIFMFLRSEEHTSELQSRGHLVCRLLLEKKKST